MNPREAMKEVLKLSFEWLEENKGLSFTQEEIDNAVELMHENDIFLDEFIDFLTDHIVMYGENYELPEIDY